MEATSPRPDRDSYYMDIAVAVRRRANCLGRRVGAVIVLEDRIIATGYNGTPQGMPNCLDGGCHRCAHPQEYESGKGYDLCICVHGEQNALLSAARFGIATEGATVYSTLRPCFGCSKELLQARIHRICYLHEWTPTDPALKREYLRLQDAFVGGVKQVVIDDPDFEWAMNPKRATAN